MIAKRNHPSSIGSKGSTPQAQPAPRKQSAHGLVVLIAIALIAIVCAVGGIVYSKHAHAQTSRVPLLTARTTTGGCTAVDARQFNPLRVFHAKGSTTAGAGAAVVEIRAGTQSDNVSTVLGTITLTLSTSATAAAGNGGFASNANWLYLCANVNSISGTGASVDASVGAN